MSESEHRPDPDKLLAKVTSPAQGKLKIFFGACAGVGKTWAMLAEARRLRVQGVDVLVGVVETHGRVETAAMLEGLPILEGNTSLNYGHGHFDLDAALTRHPAVILMDELAYSNAATARPPKRWQDIQELLDAGIDVLTTVNVQHLESLNDVIKDVAGIQVRETIPDSFFDSASEVVMVDLPPDDLHQRLREGKVYRPDQARRALHHFFRKDNLFVLRELALRRTADKVDEQRRAWHDVEEREDRAATTRDAILLCINTTTDSERLVRVAARLETKLGSEWHAVTVESSATSRQTTLTRQRIVNALQLAKRLGAVIGTLSDHDEAKTVVHYAHEHHLGKIIIGRPPHKRWRLKPHFIDRLRRLDPKADLIIVAVDTLVPTEEKERILFSSRKFYPQLRGSLAPIALCAVITFASQLLLAGFSPINLVMIYLLGVVVIALRFGRLPSIVAAIINIIAFDLCFVAPEGSFAVTDAQYLVTFTVMLIVGLLTGNMTAGIRYQARIARHRERSVRYLYQLTDGLSRAHAPGDVSGISQPLFTAALALRSEVWLPDEQGDLIPPAIRQLTHTPEASVLEWCFEKQQVMGAGSDTLPGLPHQLYPLFSAQQSLGVMVIEPMTSDHVSTPEQQRLLHTFIVLLSGTLERFALTQREQLARITAQREEIRNALLAGLSHDLRTPLTVLFGQVEMLMLDLSSEASGCIPQVNALRSQILSMVRLVNNILHMARLESEGFRLRTDWTTLDEVIGSALRSLEMTLDTEAIQLDLPDAIVLLQVDAPLLERVLVNLLENAGKYAGEEAQIGIEAHTDEQTIYISVWDNGPGIAPHAQASLFDKFTRGNNESAIPGVGMGLEICHTIVRMHHGNISASNRQQGGACFTFTLPLPEEAIFSEPPVE
ncbi:MAG: Sensor protein KdpD [Candidatus Erwinia impunctatus]|nr:Sensor protein KdpD [Culicoides impunctatus]